MKDFSSSLMFFNGYLGGRYSYQCKGNQKKSAFTLAEVLITLGIIGLVSAMTIPNLVAKYKQRMFVGQWRKTYSELANALKLMQENDEVITPLDNTSVAIEYEYAKVLGKYLKHGAICKENRFVIDGCSPESYPIYTLYGKPFNHNMGAIGGGSTCMSLLNGSIVCFDSFIVTVDVNGFSKPNTIGKDIYSALVRFETYELRPAVGSRTNWGPADGKFMLNDKGDGTCKSTNNDYGWGCSYYYMHNLP